MLMKRTKYASSHCPKTGKYLRRNWKHWWLMWLFPIAGLLSLIWFLIRVVPKPSRATYPCQRVAAPLASGFIIWLAGLIGSTLAYRKAKRLVHQSRYVLAGICVAVSITAVWWSLSVTAESPAEAAFTPTDPPNTPIGEAKGIHPGRVVWMHESAATSWDGSTGHWWDDNNTNQDVVDFMISKSIQTLTAEPNDKDAWDALFRHFNQTKGFGDIGYQQGEKIAIKVNMNNQNNPYAAENLAIDASPQMIRGLLRQLVYQAGVEETSIIVYDAMRPISDPVYNSCQPEFPQVDYRGGHGYPNRLHANFSWISDAIVYSGMVSNPQARCVPRCVLDADYIINMAILKKHDAQTAVTLCAKNHFGTIGNPSALHYYIRYWERGMNRYDPLVDLMGHANIGAKTVLYMIDGLYGSKGCVDAPKRWGSAPFHNHWPSILFVSQDPVAIDSVGLDFLRAECPLREYADNYLHEAALADNPPSGAFYDPEGDGSRLTSLGVHEHWNNPVDKRYSRNLGTGNGIELVMPKLYSTDGPVENTTTGERYDHIRYAISDASSGDTIVVSPGVYYENINLSGKNLTIISTDPNDPNIVATTVIHGSNQAVAFFGGEDPNCVLFGLTITGENNGIYCSGASPNIINCKIAGNQNAGIKLWNQSNPTIVNCIIAGNAGAGIEMWASRVGRVIPYNYARITNCTIVGNFLQGVWGGKPTITNSIIYDNGPGCDFVQIEGDNAAVTYSNIQGSWLDEGNIDDDPLFVEPGYWDENGTPEDLSDDFWVEGDYHLQWDSPCVNVGDPSFIPDIIRTDIDGEPRIIDGCVDIGCDEVAVNSLL